MFMRNWLKSFMVLHHRVMLEKGKFYLNTKKLQFDQWLSAVENGCKGDVLTLYGLSVMTNTHTYVHLHNNQYWCSVKNPPGTHTDVIAMCTKHLLYLG